MGVIVPFRRNIFLAEIYYWVEAVLYCCNEKALMAYSEALDSTTDGFVKFGSFRIGEKHNTNLNYTKH